MEQTNKVKPQTTPKQRRMDTEPEPRRQSWTIEEKSYTKCSPPVMEYMEKSSLHGLQYLAEDGRHWTERLLWTFLVILGLVSTRVFNLKIKAENVGKKFTFRERSSRKI